MRGLGGRLGALLAVAILAAACGGDDGGSSGPDPGGDTIPPITDDTSPTTTAGEPAPTSSTSEPVDDPATPDLDESAVISVDDSASAGEVRSLVRSIAVDQAVRYAGFGIEITSVDVGFDPGGFPVAEVVVTLTNDSDGSERLQTAVEIASAGSVYLLDRDLTPEVPGGATGEGAFSVRLDTAFTFADAVLFIGRSDRQRVSVPLGDTGELVTRLPTRYDEPGSGGDDDLTIDVERVVVGWDTANPRAQADIGMAFVTVDYVLDSPVNTAVNDDTIALAGPDGQAWAPTNVTITSVDAGVPTALQATFSLEEPVPDEVVLEYRERFGNGGLDVTLALG